MTEPNNFSVEDSRESASCWITIYARGDDPSSGVRIQLVQDTIVVGRSYRSRPEAPDLDLWALGISDARTVSRRHCRFVRTPEGYVVEDVESMSGTSVNDRQIHREGQVLLHPGDVVSAGRVEMAYSIEMAAA
jgi:pSer/pThr/pTyr-binding forkhead associated (FHA) protein